MGLGSGDFFASAYLACRRVQGLGVRGFGFRGLVILRLYLRDFQLGSYPLSEPYRRSIYLIEALWKPFVPQTPHL